MSLQFSDTINYKGIVQKYEKELGFERGFISDDTDRLKEFTADVNVAFDNFLALAFKADGTHQFDDSNHAGTGYPEILINVTQGDSSFPLGDDALGNLHLAIHKVFVRYENNGLYEEMTPVDSYTGGFSTQDFHSGQGVQGVPYRYDKVKNLIVVDPAFSYTQTAGLKVLIDREPSYFAHTDTTKEPGVPGHLHDYFYLQPAYEHARIKTLAATQGIGIALARVEEKIREHFARRENDVRKVLRPRITRHI